MEKKIKPDLDKDEEFPKMIDKWDSMWKMDGESAATLYILNRIDVTIYNVNFSFMSKETFFPFSSINNDFEAKLYSILLAQSLSKMQNSCLNLYTVFVLNTTYASDFNKLKDIIDEYKKKLVKATESPIFNEISENSFYGNPVTNIWNNLQKKSLGLNDIELVSFLKTMRKNNKL